MEVQKEVWNWRVNKEKGHNIENDLHQLSKSENNSSADMKHRKE